MRADLVIVGNDIHAPQQEMAAHLAENLRAMFSIPHANVVSIQSRKGDSGDGTQVIKRCSRPRQLVALLGTLARRPRAPLLYIGNGNRMLLCALAVFCALRRQNLVLYPLGRIRLPHPLPTALWLLHEDLTSGYRQQGQSPERMSVVPPFANLTVTGAERMWLGGRLLFASVPPHAHEFAERGLPDILEGLRRCNECGIAATLTILNRYHAVHSELERMIAPFGPTVTLRSEVLNDISGLLAQHDLLVAPFGAETLPQLPLSALEALSMGIPVLAHRSLALATDLHQYRAGALFDSRESIVSAVRSLRDEYALYSAGAKRLATERYSAAVARPRIEAALREQGSFK